MITEEKKQVCENVLSTSKNISPKSDSRWWWLYTCGIICEQCKQNVYIHSKIMTAYQAYLAHVKLVRSKLPFRNTKLTLCLLTGYKMYPGMEFSWIILSGIE
jgi:hypothetical protein